LQIIPTSDTLKPVEEIFVPKPSGPAAVSTNSNGLNADVQIPFAGSALKTGEKARIAVMVSASSPFRSAVLGLKFDARKLAVRSVAFGDIFGLGYANTASTPFLNQDGKMRVSLSLPEGTVNSNTGVLAYVEVEALADGIPEITLERETLNFIALDGKTFAMKF